MMFFHTGKKSVLAIFGAAACLQPTISAAPEAGQDGASAVSAGTPLKLVKIPPLVRHRIEGGTKKKGRKEFLYGFDVERDNDFIEASVVTGAGADDGDEESVWNRLLQSLPPAPTPIDPEPPTPVDPVPPTPEDPVPPTPENPTEPPVEAPTPVSPTEPPVEAPTPVVPTEAPVAAPVVQPPEFDIAQCSSYALEWLIDLQNTCVDFATLEGCECTTTQKLFDAGEITCAEEGDPSPPACPSDCEVCKTCVVLVGCPNIYSPATPTTAPVAETEPPVETGEPTPAPVETDEPTNPPVETEEPTPAPVETDEPTPALVETDEPTPAAVETEGPTPATVETEEPTPATVETDEPTPATVETEGPTPATVETEGPTPFEPEDTFDITACSSYALDWLIDLQSTCTDFITLEGCECSTAQSLLDAGEIECAEEGDPSPPACPGDCEVCKTCLVLIGCPDIYGRRSAPDVVSRTFSQQAQDGNDAVVGDSSSGATVREFCGRSAALAAAAILGVAVLV